MPAWAWAALVVMRAAQLVAVLVPLALVALLWWTWSHRQDPQLKQLLHRIAKQAVAVADSAEGLRR